MAMTLIGRTVLMMNQQHAVSVVLIGLHNILIGEESRRKFLITDGQV